MKRIPNELFFVWVESEIEKGNSVRLRLKGNSMLPFLRNGVDEVVLYPCKKEDLHPMDIVLFRFKGRHLLHRIIKMDNNHLYIRGDGSIKAKEVCLYSDVVGKVQEIIRPSGKRITLNSISWKVISYLWINSGKLRVFILKIATRF